MLTPLSPLNCGETVLQPGEAVPLTLAGWRGLVRTGRIGWQEEDGTRRRIRALEGVATDGTLHPSRLAADRHDQALRAKAVPKAAPKAPPKPSRARAQVPKLGGP